MKTFRLTFLALALAVSMLAFATTQSQAVDWPKHAVELIVPSTAGGGTDLISRVVAGNIKLHQPIALINRPGAGGTIATSEVAAAEPDGYTWLTVMPGPFVTQPHFMDLDYTLDDFRFLGVLNREPMFLVISSKAPYSTLEEFVAYAKESPTSLKYASSSTGSMPHLLQAGFYNEAGINAVHVPFNGSAEAILALLAGEVGIQCAHMSEVHSYVSSGDLKIIAAFSKDPVSFAKDVPTIASLGYDLYFDSYRFIAVPAATPADVCAIISDALRQATATPEYREFLAKNYMEIADLNEDECRQVYKAMHDYFGKVAEMAGLKKK